MPWRGALYETCRICGNPRQPDERFTARGNHRECAENRSTAQITQMRQHKGPWFDLWRRQMAASVGGILLDDVDDA